MVWRIHFTAEDLERIQVRPTLGPLAETVKAMCLLRCQQQPRAPYRPWRSQVKDRLTPQMAALTALIPPGSKGVDLAMLTGAAAVAAHQVLVEPYWTRIHACLHAEHVARLRALAARGPDGLLSSLQSQWVRWRPPVLEVLMPADCDVPLNGRGIA